MIQQPLIQIAVTAIEKPRREQKKRRSGQDRKENTEYSQPQGKQT